MLVRVGERPPRELERRDAEHHERAELDRDRVDADGGEVGEPEKKPAVGVADRPEREARGHERQAEAQRAGEHLLVEARHQRVADQDQPDHRRERVAGEAPVEGAGDLAVHPDDEQDRQPGDQRGLRMLRHDELPRLERHAQDVVLEEHDHGEGQRHGCDRTYFT